MPPVLHAKIEAAQIASQKEDHLGDTRSLYISY